MRLLTRRSTTYSLVSLVVAGLLTLIIGFVMVMAQRPVAAQPVDGHLLTVFDRGKEQRFLTQATTIADALKEAGVELDDRDAVEPARSEVLVATDYKVNVSRARPVIVVDGATRQRVVTPYQTAERIVADAGITLYPEDTTALVRSENPVTDGAGLQLTIDRAARVSLDLFGQTTQVRTQGETVGAFLREKGIVLTASDRVMPSADTPVVDGAAVRVWREGTQTVTVDETVAFTTETIRDADRPTQYKQVQTEGKNGSRRVTYEITIENGQEVGRVEIASVIVIEPTVQTEIVGTKVDTLPFTGGGTKAEWLAASNIPEESWGYADFMVTKESGWNPNAVNKSSGACGLAQALPCSKLGPDWNSPVVALNWMNNYVNGRYGGWENAYAFWVANRWY